MDVHPLNLIEKIKVFYQTKNYLNNIADKHYERTSEKLTYNIQPYLSMIQDRSETKITTI